MKTELLNACDQLVAAAINGIYQGLIVTALVALALRVLGRTNAATRHAIWFCTLLLLVFLFLAHCLMGPLAGPRPAVMTDQHATGPDPDFDLPGVIGAPITAEAARIDSGTSTAVTGYPTPGHEAPLHPALSPVGGEGGPAVAGSGEGAVQGFHVRVVSGNSPLQSQQSDSRPLPPGELAASTVQSHPLVNYLDHLKPQGNVSGDATSGGFPLEEAGSHPVNAERSAAVSEGQAPAAPVSRRAGPLAHRAQPRAAIHEMASDVSGEPTRFRRLVERLVLPVPMNLALGSEASRIAGRIWLALWLTIGVIRVFVLLLQLARIQKLKQRASAPSAGLNELFRRLASRLELKRKVELKVAPAHRASFLLGFLHPVILLPAEERLEPGEAELVLRHELAHVRRRDDWANLVQHFVLAMFFFHPAFWWISRRLSLEREIACDDHVLQHTERPQAYALLLATLAARMQRGLTLLAPVSSNNKTQLNQRIDMILDTRRNTSPRLAKTRLAVITSAVALVAAAIICSAPRIVLAQTQAPPAPAAAITLSADAPDSDPADAAPRVTRARATASSPAGLAPGSPKPPSPRTVVIATPGFPPAPAVAPTIAVPEPVPPTPFLATVQAGPAPAAPRAPRARPADSSLEARLERLERMVESLIAQQHPKPGHFDFHLKELGEKHELFDRKDIAKMEALARRQAELSRDMKPEIEKIKEMAEREAARAVGQAKRAERALQGEQKLQVDRKHKGSQKQLEALRKQLEMLEREREKLDRQIEQLEQEQEQLDEEQDEDPLDSEEPSAECKAESSVQPAVAR